MDLLKEFDRNDYDPNWSNRIKRETCRAIIFTKDNKLLMVNSTKKGYYKFPGGGVENGESIISCLIRETREEAGLTIINSSIKEYGSVSERFKALYEENSIVDQINYYYQVEVEDTRKDLLLEDYEKDLGYNLQEVSIEDAIKANEAYIERKGKHCNITRETYILKLLQK